MTSSTTYPSSHTYTSPSHSHSWSHINIHTNTPTPPPSACDTSSSSSSSGSTTQPPSQWSNVGQLNTSSPAFSSIPSSTSTTPMSSAHYRTASVTVEEQYPLPAPARPIDTYATHPSVNTLEEHGYGIDAFNNPRYVQQLKHRYSNPPLPTSIQPAALHQQHPPSSSSSSSTSVTPLYEKDTVPKVTSWSSHSPLATSSISAYTATTEEHEYEPSDDVYDHLQRDRTHSAAGSSVSFTSPLTPTIARHVDEEYIEEMIPPAPAHTPPLVSSSVASNLSTGGTVYPRSTAVYTYPSAPTKQQQKLHSRQGSHPYHTATAQTASSTPSLSTTSYPSTLPTHKRTPSSSGGGTAAASSSAAASGKQGTLKQLSVQRPRIRLDVIECYNPHTTFTTTSSPPSHQTRHISTTSSTSPSYLHPSASSSATTTPSTSTSISYDTTQPLPSSGGLVNEYIVLADIPGMLKHNIHLHIENDMLCIEGERLMETFADTGISNVIYRRAERGTGEFRRLLKIPSYVQTDHVQAKYENGVLKIIMKIVQEKVPHDSRIAVE